MDSRNVLNKIRLYLLLVIPLIVLNTAHAIGNNKGEVYKWTDESGNIHYSDIKPNNTESKKIKVSGGKSTKSATSPQAAANSLDAEKAEQQQKQTAQQKQEIEQNQREQLCQAIRDNIKKFEENSRVKINDNGALRYMTPEEITVKKAEYKVTLQERC